jgi:hypothetical protein
MIIEGILPSLPLLVHLCSGCYTIKSKKKQFLRTYEIDDAIDVVYDCHPYIIKLLFCHLIPKQNTW